MECSDFLWRIDCQLSWESIKWAVIFYFLLIWEQVYREMFLSDFYRFPRSSSTNKFFPCTINSFLPELKSLIILLRANNLCCKRNELTSRPGGPCALWERQDYYNTGMPGSTVSSSDYIKPKTESIQFFFFSDPKSIHFMVSITIITSLFR